MRSTIGLALLLLACAVSPWVQAYQRAFPAHAVRGKMTPGFFPEVLIDGKPRQLAPSARIFNQENLIELPAAIRGSDLLVNYTVDSWGNIDRIWLLTAEEAAQPPAGEIKR